MSYEEIKSYNHVIDELQKENAKLLELCRHFERGLTEDFTPAENIAWLVERERMHRELCELGVEI